MDKKNVVTLAHCGALGCKRMVEVDENKPKPDVFICGTCQEKFDKGIVEWLHLNTGKLKGGYHITDGYRD